MQKKLIIIDSHSLLYKAFFGVRLMHSSQGVPTNAIYGYLNMLLKLIREQKPDYLIAAYDKGKTTFRHSSYPEYKAGRASMPEDLRTQIPKVWEILEKANVKLIGIENYEADDIIGSIAKIAGSKDIQSIIVTGDRDSFQLAGRNTEIFYAKRGVSDIIEVTPEYLRKEFDLSAPQIIELKSLMGDKSDNIPGVAGVGEKTALNLLHTYSTLDGVYENIDSIKGKLREKLIKDRENAYMSRDLATICTDCIKEFDFSEAEKFDFRDEAVISELEELDMHSIIKGLGVEEEKKATQISFTEKTVQDLLSDLASFEGKTFSFAYEYNALTDEYSMALSLDGSTSVYTSLPLEDFRKICENEDIGKIAHDYKQIYKDMYQRGIHPKGFVFDTMIAGYVLNPSDERYRLDELCAKYTDFILFVEKNEQQSLFSIEEDDTFKMKLAQSCMAIEKLYAVLRKKLAEEEMTELYFDIEFRLIEVLASMEIYGFRVHSEFLKELENGFDARISELSSEIYSLAGKDESFNINSPKQLGVLLFEELQLPVVKKTKTGYSTNIEVLEKLRGMHPIIQKIIELRQITKLDSTYVKGLLPLIQKDGKIHSTFNQTITVTGRISSSNPNLQNIPVKTEQGRKIRRVFVADEGNTLIDADYSQIELRILAHISGDENLIRAFQNDEDIHARTASEVFGVRLDEVTKVQRSRAKAVNFGIVYGISDFGLGKSLNIPRKDARVYIDTYFRKFPKVKKYMDDIVLDAREKGYVTTMFNRRRYLPDIHSSNFNIRSFAERTAYNTPIQGSAADIIKIAMINVKNRLERENLKARLILQVHDELIIDTPLNEEEKVRELLQYEMEHAVKLSVPLKVDISSAYSWYDAKY